MQSTQIEPMPKNDCFLQNILTTCVIVFPVIRRIFVSMKYIYICVSGLNSWFRLFMNNTSFQFIFLFFLAFCRKHLFPLPSVKSRLLSIQQIGTQTNTRTCALNGEVLFL